MKASKAARGSTSAPAVQLYRRIIKELPRVLHIYDMDTDLIVARTALYNAFKKNANVRDPRVVDMLISKGYMELEETLLQFKQKTHLMRILEPHQTESPLRSKREGFLNQFYAGQT
ncbi:unnamed protein product [Phaeothamnion confervicola]